MDKKRTAKRVVFYTFLAVVLIIILFLAISSIFKKTPLANGIAIIPIKGAITTTGQDGFFAAASSSKIMEMLEKADKNNAVRAIIIEIDSPGGNVVASREIASKVKQAKKPVVSWIRESGASGAYWIASASDYIVADELSITGSIGVIGSYVEFAGFLERYNLTYRRLVSGENKDIGDPFTELTSDKERILMQKLDIVKNNFIENVAQNRNLSVSDVEKVADGFFMFGREAYEKNLIDELGGKQEAINSAMKLSGISDYKIVDYGEKASLLNLFSKFFQQSAYSAGYGLGDSIKTRTLNLQ